MALFLSPAGAQAAAGWSATGNLGTDRYGHTATLLSNGKVLVAGGHRDGDFDLDTAELYDPATGTWSGKGSMAAPRSFGQAVLPAQRERAGGRRGERRHAHQHGGALRPGYSWNGRLRCRRAKRGIYRLVVSATQNGRTVRSTLRVRLR